VTRAWRWSRSGLVGLTAAAVVAVDQLTKSLAEADLRDHPVHLLGPLSLRLTYNSGAAFSLGQGLSSVIVVIGAVVVVMLVVAGRRVQMRSSAVAVGLLLGGAVGNLSDRLFRANHGAVIDFIATRYWPTFNVADACIVVGAGLLVWSARRGGRVRAPGRQEDGRADGP
jgi:signal peptidase II